MKLTFNRKYLFMSIALLLTEILIAIYLNDRFVRPYVGDFLVVMLIYCFVKAFRKVPVLPAAAAVLVFSYAIEFLQYFHFVNYLGLKNSKLARTVLGTSFNWADLLAYTLGVITIIFIEKITRHKTGNKDANRSAWILS